MNVGPSPGARPPALPPRSSAAALQLRALLAVVLLVGFYALALGMVVLLAWAPAQIESKQMLRIAIPAWICAGVLLWSILPRIERFEPPGPELTRAHHPRLFEEIERIAREAGQPLPDKVYLVGDVNAFVAQHGGWMGLGGKRVMGIGLGLLASFDVDEARSVMAHEFGHFTGGDTALGPWIHRTRSALERTLRNLKASQERIDWGLAASVLWIARQPFQGFWVLFMRSTQAVSRNQEFAADRLAARLAGRDAAHSALARLDRASLAYDSFVQSEYLPLLGSGHRAPLVVGYARFLESPQRLERLDALLAESRRKRRPHPYDSHPPTADRLRALEALPEDGRAHGAREPARELLSDLEACELELLAFLNGPERMRTLQTITWEEAPARAILPGWRRNLKHSAGELRGMRAGELAELARDSVALGRRLRAPDGEPLGPQQALHALGGALALALADAGWEFRFVPGEPLHAVRGAEQIEPFALVEGLERGRGREDWSDFCARNGLGELPLWPAEPAA